MLAYQSNLYNLTKTLNLCWRTCIPIQTIQKPKNQPLRYGSEVVRCYSFALSSYSYPKQLNLKIDLASNHPLQCFCSLNAGEKSPWVNRIPTSTRFPSRCFLFCKILSRWEAGVSWSSCLWYGCLLFDHENLQRETHLTDFPGNWGFGITDPTRTSKEKFWMSNDDQKLGVQHVHLQAELLPGGGEPFSFKHVLEWSWVTSNFSIGLNPNLSSSKIYLLNLLLLLFQFYL